MKHSASTKLACPIHKNLLDDKLFCSECGKEYPSVNGIPILINDTKSVFRISDYVNQKSYEGASSYAGHLDKSTGLRRLYRQIMFSISESEPPNRDYDVTKAVDYILSLQPDSEILVIGSGDMSIKGNVTYTDVAFGANTQYIADAHDLPFLANSFDAIIAVAVLEHVADPYECVNEFMRVLRPGGFIFSETPFMQPVHMREYDFTRFTYLGHRRLFRYFKEVHSGFTGASGTSAGHLLRYAITSLSDKPNKKKWLKLFALLFTYPLRWLDYISATKLSTYDSASGFYFFGTLCKEPISDRDLLQLYRGS